MCSSLTSQRQMDEVPMIGEGFVERGQHRLVVLASDPACPLLPHAELAEDGLQKVLGNHLASDLTQSVHGRC